MQIPYLSSRDLIYCMTLYHLYNNITMQALGQASVPVGVTPNDQNCMPRRFLALISCSVRILTQNTLASRRFLRDTWSHGIFSKPVPFTPRERRKAQSTDPPCSAYTSSQGARESPRSIGHACAHARFNSLAIFRRSSSFQILTAPQHTSCKWARMTMLTSKRCLDSFLLITETYL